MRFFAYLWLPPGSSKAQQEQLCQQRQSQLQAFVEGQGACWQSLEVDHSLNANPAERPVLKRLLRQIGEQDVLLVQDLLDLGRRFYDVYALLDWFRQEQHRGCFQALAQNLSVNRQQQNDLLLVLSQIPQLCPPALEKVEEQPAFSRSELSRQNGGACPYGYTVNRKTNEYELIPAEAQVVRRIFKARQRNKSLRQIAQDLTHQGFTTKRGGKWHANTIKSILENPFYMGVYQTHFTTFEKHHPALVSAEIYYQLNAHLLCDDIAM